MRQTEGRSAQLTSSTGDRSTRTALGRVCAGLRSTRTTARHSEVSDGAAVAVRAAGQTVLRSGSNLRKTHLAHLPIVLAAIVLDFFWSVARRWGLVVMP